MLGFTVARRPLVRRPFWRLRALKLLFSLEVAFQQARRDAGCCIIGHQRHSTLQVSSIEPGVLLDVVHERQEDRFSDFELHGHRYYRGEAASTTGPRRIRLGAWPTGHVRYDSVADVAAFADPEQKMIANLTLRHATRVAPEAILLAKFPAGLGTTWSAFYPTDAPRCPAGLLAGAGSYA